MNEGSSRRRVRHRIGQCSWPKCERSLTDKYHDVPLCTDHAEVVHWRVQSVNARDLDEANLRRMGSRHTSRVNVEGDPPWGDIYYLRIDDRIKIGHARNLTRRLAAYPPTSDLLAVEPGSRTAEADRHKQFSAFLIAGREWYSQAPEILRHIETVIERHGKPDQSIFGKRRSRNRQVVALRSRSGGNARR